MKLYIKNMVCDRCKLAVKNVLDDMALQPESIQLGEVDLGKHELDDTQLDAFRQRIEALGFELINDRKSRLIESIKKHIIALVRERDELEKVKLSDYLSEHLHHDYTYLSNLFSAVEGVTIEQYFIHQKIERAKELLVYDELTLTEIAFRLGYSSLAHLSRQFKKVTGLTPTHFKQLRDTRQRQPLDKIH
jgi:AraC-like DNA-binding protein